ncbi:ankyrin repeat-containing domain protein [Xylaria grammica]|nr:ankyrin repeat-containing domain protein [Xylaria grammica]
MVFKTLRRKLRLRGRKDSRNQDPLETSARPSTAEEASINTSLNPDGSSTSKLPPVDTPPSQPPPPVGVSSRSSPIPIRSDTSIRELWNEAYANLRKENQGLVAEYEDKLCGDLGVGVVSTLGSEVSMRDRMHAILQRKMDEVNRDVWKLKFGSSDLRARELAQPVLGVVNRANNFISAAVSVNPYASLAWAGVSVLLPLFLNPSEQAASLAKGLDHVSSLISQSRMWEDLYLRRYESELSAYKSSTPSHVAYRDALEQLYRQILKFQATSYCYYTKKTTSRLGLDILKLNEWDSLLNEIRDKELEFSAICASWRDMKYDEECSAAADRHKETISHWRDIGVSVSGLREAVRQAQQEKNRDEFLDWLCKVDPSVMYNGARDKHESGTCDWLVKDNKKFKSWERSPSSLIWVHGKPGCGKSIISSSVVKHLQERYTSDPEYAFAYFFFSFSDRERQKVDIMLSSLIRQLYVCRPDTPQSIKELGAYKQKGERPDTKTLENALMATTSGFSSVSLVIDALDECPTVHEERSKLLSTLSRVSAKLPDNIHIFLTSRAERDIRVAIDAIRSPPSLSRTAIDLTVDQEGVNHDIGLYVDSRLGSSNYSSWPDDVKTKVKDELIRRADGMFQYVVYQFEGLEKIDSAADIDKALEQLPFGLNATYDRVLQAIDPQFRSQIVSLLKWLVASVRPLRLEELAETWILRPEHAVPFDVTHRLFNPKDCVRYISSLVVLFVKTRGETKGDEKLPEGTYVRLAHFSVREYLTSTADNRPTGFSFTEFDAHLHIAHWSLACHLYRSTLSGDGILNLELDDYTTRNWALHLEMVPRETWSDKHVLLAARALDLGSRSLRRMLMVRTSMTRYPNRVDTNLNRVLIHCMLRAPQCYTSRLGFLKLTEMLLPGGPRAGKYLGQHDLDMALQEAAYGGNLEMIQLLLDRGACVNAKSERLGSPIWAAARNGHAAAVELLLNRGADINEQHSRFGSALQIAVENSNLYLVKLLVSHGADVNLPGIVETIPKEHWRGRIQILEYLLDSGLNINTPCGNGETALHAVANGDSEDLEAVSRLLERGADVNAQGGRYGNALQAACVGGTRKKKLVELLLKRGADINAQGGFYGSALQAACWFHNGSGLERFTGSDVELLLSRGANINAQGGEYGTALQAAAHDGRKFELVKILLGKGADIGVQGGRYGNALQAGSLYGSQESVQLLLDHGADVNATGGEYGCALQAAAQQYTIEVLELLLSKGAKVNTQGGWYGTALQAACFDDNVNAVRLLLDHGAEVNARGGRYGTALQAACHYNGRSGNDQVRVDLARLLIERGADVNLQGGESGSAWYAAVLIPISSTLDTIKPLQQLLLDHGVDVNTTQGQQHPAALQTALEFWDERSNWDNIRLNRTIINQVRFLLEHGADANIGAGLYGFPLQSACAAKRGAARAIYLLENCPELEINARGGMFGSALQAAAYSGQAETVELLLEKGADPNMGGGKYRSALNAAVFQGFWHIVEMLLKHGAKSDRQQQLEPDEEWLARIREEGVEEEDGMMEKGEVAVERYRIFWERQPLSEGTRTDDGVVKLSLD